MRPIRTYWAKLQLRGDLVSRLLWSQHPIEIESGAEAADRVLNDAAWDIAAAEDVEQITPEGSPDRFEFDADRVIDVEPEIPEIPPPPGRSTGLAAHFNTETEFQGLSLSQLAVHSLWIVDYLRSLGHTEMADGDLDSLVRCADDLESSIMLMFQLAGGTRMELRQRYEALKTATLARNHMTMDMPRRQ